jgi:CubicO group peptidase (beta-lactamase class C family)
MKPPTWTSCILLGTCFLAGHGVVEAAETPAVVEGDLGREIDRLLAGCVDWGFSGSVLVVRDDEVLVRKGYGFADRAHEIPNTPDTLFEIASVAKQFTAAAVLKLEEEGRLSTGDSIAEWLPGLPEAHAGVTIDHLLAHTSGFPRMGPTGDGPDAPAALVAYLAGGRVREIGTGFEYWNGGYALLAMIIERASGRTLEAYCREALFDPAGMSSTGFCGETPSDATRLAHGYHENHDVGDASAHSFGWEYRGMGGVVTSVVDLHRWDESLRGGKVLRSTEKLEAAGPSGYACGAWVEPTSRGTRQLMLGGNVSGFNSAFWRMPEDRATVVVLCNTSDNAMIVGMHVARRLFDQPGFLQAAPEAVALAPDARARIGGTFRGDDGMVVHVELRDAAFVVWGEGQPVIQMLLYGDVAVAPHVQAGIDQARRILRGVMEDDYEPFRVAMAEGIPADWPDRFRPHWQESLATRGAIESVEFVGAWPTAVSPTSVRVRFRLRHANGDALAELQLDRGRLHVFHLDARGPVTEFRFLPTSPMTLETYRMGPGVLPVIEIDDKGERLTLRSPRGGALSFTRNSGRP